MNAYQQVITNLESRMAEAQRKKAEHDTSSRECRVQVDLLQHAIEALRECLPPEEEPPTPEPGKVKPLRLEVGKRYVRRNGSITPAISHDCGSDLYPFTDGSTTWTAQGYRYDWQTDDLDLIAEYVDPSEGWEFFQGRPSHSGTRSFWAFKGDQRFFQPWHTLGWRTCTETKEAVSAHPSVTPIPNLPPGIPMP